MKRVLLLTADDWQALYVDEIAVTQEHKIRAMDLLSLVQEYSFSASDVDECEASQADWEKCMQDGEFPSDRGELISKYP